MSRTARLWSVAGALMACLRAAAAPSAARRAGRRFASACSRGGRSHAAGRRDRHELSRPRPRQRRLRRRAPRRRDAAAAEYEPPFPDRIDLFVPPKRQGGAVRSGYGGDNSVELMGFVRVDRPRAVLSINGEITPMAEGETQFGVEVISVQPPNVVLQRGRQRWQATLE